MRLNMKKVFNEVDQSVTFTFTDLDSVTIRLGDVTAANQRYAALAGLGHKVGDNAAFSKADYPVVTEEMRRNAVVEMVNHLTTSDSWDMTVRKVKAAPIDPVVQAIATKLGKTYAEAQAWYQAKMLADLAAM